MAPRIGPVTATIATAIVVAQANRAVATAGGRSAAATAAKKSGKTAVMMVVWKAEFAQSYIAQARSSGRWRPRRERIVTPKALVRLPGDPFAEQRIDDHVLLPLLEQQVLLHEGRQRRLNARRAAKAVPRADVGRQKLAAALKNDGANDRALRKRQSLPDRLEQRVLLRKKASKRAMQLLEARFPATRRFHVVPGFVRETLDIVGEIPRKVDDGGAQPGLGADGGARESRFD